MPNIKFGNRTFENVENISVPLADGTGQASFGTGGELTGTNEQYHNLPEAVRKYLSEVTYDPTNYSVSKITEYVSGDSAEAYAVGLNLDVADEGVLNRDGYEQNVSTGMNVIYNDIPGQKTPYTVSKNDKVIQCGSVEPLDRVRRIKCNTINVRDLGGWKCDGGAVKYGMLYRGGEANAADRDVLVNQCGIRHDLNLRGADEATWSASPLGEDVHFTKADEFNWYSVNINDAWRTNLRCVFDAVTHGEPVFFHCAAGADRTGTLACILEGLLGMNQSDIDKDYELTCFWTGVADDNAARRRNEAEWQGLINGINAFEGDTFRDKCVTFAAQLGFTADEINAYRKAMIDGTPEEVQPDIPVYTVISTLDDAITSNNTDTTAVGYQPYETTITPADGYVISDITITMGGKNITNTVFKGTETDLYRSVTVALENCTIDNSKTKVIDGQGYVANLTASDGYTMDGADVTITMGGIDVSKYYTGGKVAIPNVTGNIVITAKAVAGEDDKEEIVVKWIENYGCNYNVGEKFGATAIEGYCVTETFDVTPGTEYTIEITDDEFSALLMRFVGGSDNNLVTETESVTYSNSSRTHKFTPSEGTTKMMLRGYVNQGTASLNWKITYSGGDSNNPITLVNRMSVQTSNLNKRISGADIGGTAGAGTFIADPIAVDLSKKCPVVFKNFAASMGALLSGGIYYNSKVALLDVDKECLAVWYIGYPAIDAVWICSIDGDDLIGDLTRIFDSTPGVGNMPCAADVAYVIFAPSLSHNQISESDLDRLEIQMP